MDFFQKKNFLGHPDMFFDPKKVKGLKKVDFFVFRVAPLKHSKRGVLAMATARPNENLCQFYITFAPLPHLNGRATIFGTVIDGMDVLAEIERLKVIDQKGWKPEIDIAIKSCTIHANPLAE